MPKDKLKFKLVNFLTFEGKQIPYDPSLSKNFGPLIYEPDFSSKIIRLLVKGFKPLIYRLVNLRNYLLVNGFIKTSLASLIDKYFKKGSSFLEIGCGDMSMKKYLPPETTYNAFDVRLSRYNLLHNILDPHTNICLASILKIPLKNESVDLILISEVLYEINNINQAIKEIFRILKKNGQIIVSISNSFCYKYVKKGPHPRAKNFWSYQSFIDLMTQNKLSLVESFQKGFWLPTPLKLTHTSYQLPFTSKQEYYNTNFFYVFRK